jgi:hypothetical protein
MAQQQPHEPAVAADVEGLGEPVHGGGGAVELAWPGECGELRALLEAGDHALDPVRWREGVRVQSRQHVPGRGVEAAGGGRPDAADGLGHHQGARRARHLGRVVRAAVVDHHDLVGQPGLRGQGPEASPEHRRVVERGNDDGDASHGPTSIVLHP